MFRRALVPSLLLVCLSTGVALPQVIRLPAVEPPMAIAPGEVILAPDVGDELLLPPPEFAEPAPDPDRPPDARDGLFQKLIFTDTWLARTGTYGLGMSDLQLKTVLAFPIPSRDWPLIVTPGFGVHFLDGPVVSDLPPRLYDAYVQFRSMKRLSPRWAADVGITPGVYSDFEQSSDKAFRITGYGAAMFTWTPTTKLLLGVAYLDREDLRVLPIGGILWNPTPDLAIELSAPRPRIAQRLYWNGALTDEVQDWVYLAGELGGGIWAIRRVDGSNDETTYTDYRIILGVERRDLGGLDGHIEVGYVFGRSLEYRSRDADIDLNPTVMVRGGVTY
jgi:hypothetical protein